MALTVSSLINLSAADSPQVDIVVDASQFSETAVRNYLVRYTKLVESWTVFSPRIMLIVKLAPTDFHSDLVSFIELGNSPFVPTARLSLAFQIKHSENIIFCSTLTELSENSIKSILSSLAVVSLVEAKLNTLSVSGEHSDRHSSSRTVCFGIRKEAYNAIRGFDLRIDTLRDSYEDFRRRLMNWEGLFSQVYLDSNSQAFPPESIEHSRNRHKINTANPSIFVNFPRWKYRPFDSVPTVTLVRFGKKSERPRYDLATAQSMDGVEVLELQWEKESSTELIDEVLTHASGEVLLFAQRDQSVPPWLAEQLVQQLRSSQEMCVGGVATELNDQVWLEKAPKPVVVEQLPSLVELCRSVMPVSLVRFLRTGENKFLNSRTRPTGAIAAFNRSAVESKSNVVAADFTEAIRYRPYLSEGESPVFMVFDQYGAGRTDYINGYSRVVAVLSRQLASGKFQKEFTVLENPTIDDARVLADLGIRFELLQPAEGFEELLTILAGRLVGSEGFECKTVEDLHHVIDCRNPGTNEQFLWISIRDWPVKAVRLTPAMGSTMDELTIGALFAQILKGNARQ